MNNLNNMLAKPAILFGVVFGILSLLHNLMMLSITPSKLATIVLLSGLIFFNCLFTVLFTKRINGYRLEFIAGFKQSIQAGIIQSLFYFMSIVVIRLWLSPDTFPDLNTIGQYMLNLNYIIILFAILSALFGSIASILLMSQTTKS